MINVRMQSPTNRLKPKITVIGVGGAGGNAVNNMINSQLEGCEFLVCNTDAQALEGSSAPHKIQLGANVTRGLGAGANPEIGRAAAEESLEEILAYLEGSNMVFVTAGMGGGTGTGAAPVIAQAAREAGILTIGVVTKPFHFEGTHRMKLAENGIAELQKYVDTLIIIPNQNLFRIANEKTTFADAFKMADEVLQSGVRGVTDLMVMPGLINLDFADVRAVMLEMGKAMMGTGIGQGERRAIEAAEAAISNPLLDDVSMKGAKGVLINVIGGLDMTLFEVDEAINRIRDEVDPDANIIFGSTFDQTMDGAMRVSVVATGIEAATMVQPRPLQVAGAQVEPARRGGLGGAKPAGSLGTQTGGYGYTAAPQARDAGFTGGIPSSIIPAHASQARAAIAQKTAAPVTAGEGNWQAAETAAEPAVGHAAGFAAAPAAAATATARKLDDEVSESETWTRPNTPAQSYNRTVPPVTQPRAERHGNSFIPPKPVDPRQSGAPSGDLFGEAEAAAPKAASVAAEKPVKKSPSLFERFTLQRHKEEAVEAPAAASSATVTGKLTVEEGGKKEEDELDIPAFLRRQAN
ncbi:MAG TPA: cell division protein FtsZ [Alphaproteobacteria bacterium]|nr:cell division protein FtsZ [Alphaproteobacteria bacterium]